MFRYSLVLLAALFAAPALSLFPGKIARKTHKSNLLKEPSLGDVQSKLFDADIDNFVTNGSP